MLALVSPGMLALLLERHRGPLHGTQKERGPLDWAGAWSEPKCCHRLPRVGTIESFRCRVCFWEDQRCSYPEACCPPEGDGKKTQQNQVLLPGLALQKVSYLFAAMQEDLSISVSAASYVKSPKDLWGCSGRGRAGTSGEGHDLLEHIHHSAQQCCNTDCQNGRTRAGSSLLVSALFLVGAHASACGSGDRAQVSTRGYWVSLPSHPRLAALTPPAAYAATHSCSIPLSRCWRRTAMPVWLKIMSCWLALENTTENISFQLPFLLS